MIISKKEYLLYFPKKTKPYPENLMTAHTISRLITDRTKDSNSPEVLENFNYPELQLLS